MIHVRQGLASWVWAVVPIGIFSHFAVYVRGFPSLEVPYLSVTFYECKSEGMYACS